MNELPSITSSSYTTNAISPTVFVASDSFYPKQATHDWHETVTGQKLASLASLSSPPNLVSKKETQMSLRLIRVIIADPCESLPLEKRMLYQGEEQVTDLTDQELYYEIPIKSILDRHNEFRTTVYDKTKKEKTKLEPIRIRDLKMVVVQIAAF